MNTVSDPPGIVELLQADIRGEHAAIMQYLQHAYRLPAGELPGDVEEIAREEMRHFRWLCEMAVELGGSPTIERDPIFLDAPSETDLLRLDIDAEDRAIAQYQDHIARIDHPRVVRLLERILADELAHRQEFGGLVEELGGMPETDHDPVSTTGDTRRRLSDELRQQGAHVARIEDLRDETEDPETRFLLGRIHLHDAYAADQLHDLLAQLDEEPCERRPTPNGLGHLTVGSLLGQRQP